MAQDETEVDTSDLVYINIYSNISLSLNMVCLLVFMCF